MSGSVSPLPWTGSKGCIYTTIDAFMPPHKTYVEACMGSAEVFLRKKPSEREIINDYNGDLVKFFRVLQRSEKLAYLLGRLYLSFNSEQLFKANKAMLADVPNILDDITETSVIIENAEWSDIEKAVSFSEAQADRLASVFLMPRFILQKVMKKYRCENGLPIYGWNVFAPEDKIKLRKMADCMGVSFQALVIRLKTLGLLIPHDLTEYLEKGLQLGGGSL